MYNHFGVHVPEREREGERLSELELGEEEV